MESFDAAGTKQTTLKTDTISIKVFSAPVPVPTTTNEEAKEPALAEDSTSPLKWSLTGLGYEVESVTVRTPEEPELGKLFSFDRRR